MSSLAGWTRSNSLCFVRSNINGPGGRPRLANGYIYMACLRWINEGNSTANYRPGFPWICCPFMSCWLENVYCTIQMLQLGPSLVPTYLLYHPSIHGFFVFILYFKEKKQENLRIMCCFDSCDSSNGRIFRKAKQLINEIV